MLKRSDSGSPFKHELVLICIQLTSPEYGECVYVCVFVYFGTCLTMQNSETANNGSEKEDM